MNFKLLSYNIRFGGRGREERLAEVIRRAAPDMVVFQEATDPFVIQKLSEATNLPNWAARSAHSVAYISRTAVRHHEWHALPGCKHPFMEIVLEGGARIFGLHLKARFSKWSERQREFEIRALLGKIEEHRRSFHLLVGDFNTLAPGEILDTRRMPRWIRALVWASGRDIQRATIQVMLDAGYIDGYRKLHPEESGYTFPTWDAHLRLDYIFLPSQYASALSSCEVIREGAASTASDHFPLAAEINLEQI